MLSPMELSPEDIAAFIDMWLAEFGERLSEDQARAEAMRLVNFGLELEKPREPNGGQDARNGTIAE
ncbi:hypothetical protein KW785_01920 [Candidatus Parcubacteria bacterium]|nr:hypothetical protein [Candidatus Parcubacteria bacterium]